MIQKVNSDTSDLVKKADYNTTINEIEKRTTDHYHNNKYITIQMFNGLTAMLLIDLNKQIY